MIEAFKEICKLSTEGEEHCGIRGRNDDAFDFCKSLYDYFHLIDDLFDRDVARSPEDVIGAAINLLFACHNRFFQEHWSQLAPVVVSSSHAWAASERLRKSDKPEDKLAAEVLKSQYQDIFFFVAQIIGGSAHALEMDKKWRGYNFG